jgi:hypothetical protein
MLHVGVVVRQRRCTIATQALIFSNIAVAFHFQPCHANRENVEVSMAIKSIYVYLSSTPAFKS